MAATFVISGFFTWRPDLRPTASGTAGIVATAAVLIVMYDDDDKWKEIKWDGIQI